MNSLTSLWRENIQPKFYTWWDCKTTEEKADLESSFAIVVTGLGSIAPILLLSLL